MTVRTIVTIICACAVLLAAACEKKAEEPAVQKAAAPAAQVTGLEAIIAPDAVMVKVSEGVEFDTAASPAYVDGELYFTNTNFDAPEKCRTMKIDRAGTLHILRENNGLTSAIQRSGKGTFYCCEMLGHRVIEMGRDGTVLRVVAGEYNGKRIDGPNDLVIDRKGGIYFTDSQYIAGREKMQEMPAVYYVKPGGEVIRVADGIEFPNGVELSPDEQTLYVVNTRGATKGRFVRAYDILDDGTLANGRDFAEVQLAEDQEADPEGTGGADGSAVDSQGNLYIATTKGLGIQVFDRTGKHLGNIPCPSISNNVYFGNEDLKTLYVAAKDGIYRVPVNIPGMNIPQE